MAENKSKDIEREYVIPLRDKSRIVPRYRKTPKAVKTIKEFLVKHMKIYDRDLNKIKIDKHLNEYLWFRGIRKHPHKVKVKAKKQGENVFVELVELPDKLKFKKAREDKLKTKSKEAAQKKKSLKEKALEGMKGSQKGDSKEEKPDKKSKVITSPEIKPEDKDADGVKDKKEEKESKEAVNEQEQKTQEELKKESKKSPKKSSAKKKEANPKN